MTTRTTRLWHPFAAMGKVDGHELVLTRGEGARVWDPSGAEYIDATAGLWFANVGHGRTETADAVSALDDPPRRASQTLNQRARRLAPNSRFSATSSSDGGRRVPVGFGPDRKSTSTRPTRPLPNST